MSASISTGTGIYPAKVTYLGNPKDLETGLNTPGLRSILGIEGLEVTVMQTLLLFSQDLGTWKAVSGQRFVVAVTAAQSESITADLACAAIQRLVDQGHIKCHYEDEGQTPVYCLAEGCVAKLFAYARSMSTA